MKRTLKELRTSHGLTQAELSDRSGVSIRTIKYAEAGHRMSINTIVHLAQVLDVSIMELVDVDR